MLVEPKTWFTLKKLKWFFTIMLHIHLVYTHSQAYLWQKNIFKITSFRWLSEVIHILLHANFCDCISA